MRDDELNFNKRMSVCDCALQLCSKTLANDLVSVAPMSAPNGLLYAEAELATTLSEQLAKEINKEILEYPRTNMNTNFYYTEPFGSIDYYTWNPVIVTRDSSGENELCKNHYYDSIILKRIKHAYRYIEIR